MINDATVYQKYGAIFKTNGREGAHTFSWNTLSPAHKDEIVNVASIFPGELPVVVSMLPHNRMLLSTRRLIFLDQPGDVILESILSVSPTAGPGKVSLENMTKLVLRLQDGRDRELQLESGAPLSGIWNILVHVVRHNARTNTIRDDHR